MDLSVSKSDLAPGLRNTLDAADGDPINAVFVDDEGNELDMGTGWDYFGEESHVFHENLTEEQKDNRMLLRTLMLKHGFKPYEFEWWHFTLDNEPYPNIYFDFPVN